MPVKRIDHIAVIISDLDHSLTFWRDALGMELERIEDVPEQEASVAFLPIGDSEVELVRPSTATSGLARYLAKRGPGLHHLCLEVDDLAGMLQRLKEHGVRLIDETPRSGSGGKQLAFVHPESTGGVLVELYQLQPVTKTL